MKTQTKKVPRNFRLAPDIDAELQRASVALGVPETRIVEDALRYHLTGNIRAFMKKKLDAFSKGLTLNPKFALTPDPMLLGA